VPNWILAYQLESKKINVSSAYISVLNDKWFGHVHRDNNFIKLLVHIFCPFLLFVWVPQSEGGTESNAGGTLSSIGNAIKAACFVRMDHEAMFMDDPPGHKRAYLSVAVARVREFYDSPITTFYMEVVAFLTILVLYTYSTLEKAMPISVMFDEINGGGDLANAAIAQFLSVGWIMTMVLNELDDMVLGQGLRVWSQSMWNKWDLVMYFFVLWGFFMRARAGGDDTVFNLIAGKVLGGIGAMLLWIRAMRYFAYSQTMGPKVNMMIQMVEDIIVFCVLLILILLGYGVAAIAVQEPTRGWDDSLFMEIMFRPAFQMYGETFLDQIHEDSTCVGPDFISCTFYSKLSVVLLMFYLLIANILLVNLLIAMMSSRYEQVAEESMEYWSLEYTKMLEEFRVKFPLPAPLCVVFNVARFGSAGVRQIRKLVHRATTDAAVDEGGTSIDTFEIDDDYDVEPPDKEEIQEREKFLTENMAAYLVDQKNESKLDVILDELARQKEMMYNIQDAVVSIGIQLNGMSSGGGGGGGAIGGGGRRKKPRVTDRPDPPVPGSNPGQSKPKGPPSTKQRKKKSTRPDKRQSEANFADDDTGTGE